MTIVFKKRCQALQLALDAYKGGIVAIPIKNPITKEWHLEYSISDLLRQDEIECKHRKYNAFENRARK